jgi:hypothetical protein
MLIETRHGKVYEVLGEDTEYSMLKCNSSGKFVVAYMLKEFQGGYYEI